MRKKLNQLGFGAIEAVLIVVIAGIIGGTGYLVYKNRNKPAADTTPQQNSSQANNDEALPNAEVAAQTYLEIKEWDVRMKTDATTSDIYYVPRADQPEYMDFFVKSIDNLKNKNGETCKDMNYPLFVVGRFEKNDPKLDDPLYASGEKITIDTYVFTGLGANQSAPACANTGTANEDNNVLVKYEAAEVKISTLYKTLETVD